MNWRLSALLHERRLGVLLYDIKSKCVRVVISSQTVTVQHNTIP